MIIYNICSCPIVYLPTSVHILISVLLIVSTTWSTIPIPPTEYSLSECFLRTIFLGVVKLAVLMIEVVIFATARTLHWLSGSLAKSPPSTCTMEMTTPLSCLLQSRLFWDVMRSRLLISSIPSNISIRKSLWPRKMLTQILYGSRSGWKVRITRYAHENVHSTNLAHPNITSRLHSWPHLMQLHPSKPGNFDNH